MIKLLPVQLRMMDLLADGLPHTREELHALCPGNRYGKSALRMVRVHMVGIRKAIAPYGEIVVCELVNRRICYRRARFLSSPYDGRR